MDDSIIRITASSSSKISKGTHSMTMHNRRSKRPLFLSPPRRSRRQFPSGGKASFDLNRSNPADCLHSFLERSTTSYRRADTRVRDPAVSPDSYFQRRSHHGFDEYRDLDETIPAAPTYTNAEGDYNVDISELPGRTDSIIRI